MTASRTEILEPVAYWEVSKLNSEGGSMPLTITGNYYGNTRELRSLLSASSTDSGIALPSFFSTPSLLQYTVVVHTHAWTSPNTSDSRASATDRERSMRSCDNVLTRGLGPHQPRPPRGRRMFSIG